MLCFSHIDDTDATFYVAEWINGIFFLKQNVVNDYSVDKK